MTLITTTAELQAALVRLTQDSYITIDTEFHRQTTYYPHLCLIQIASPAGQALIDPLSKHIDLTDFFAVMQRPSLLKVFHAGRQDIEIFYHLSGKIPAPLFDTQIAAMACGYGESVSYDTLTYKIAGKRLDKSLRFTNWDKRPLTAKQMEYALADVTYLRDIYQTLDRQLRAKQRYDWLKDEMAILESEETYQSPPEQAWKKIKGLKKLRTAEQAALLRDLAAWREQQAQQRDMPRMHVLNDDSLVEIVLQRPQNRQELLSMRVLRKPPHSADIEPILARIAASRNRTGGANPPPPQFVAWSSSSENNKSETEILKLLLKIIAEQHDVAQKLIATSDDLGKLAMDGEKADIAAMRGWRFELFGEKALSMLSGDLAIKFEKGKPCLFKPPHS